MNDISYEILDLFKKYGSDPEGIQKILENDRSKTCSQVMDRAFMMLL